jgi:hypothetical protein
MPTSLEKCLSLLNQQEGEHSWTQVSPRQVEVRPNVYQEERVNSFVCGRCGYRLNSAIIIEELIKIKQRHPNSGLNPLKRIEAPFEARLEQLEQELATERETTQQALQTSQEWHERQKNEIIARWKRRLTVLLNVRKEKVRQELQLIREVLNE